PPARRRASARGLTQDPAQILVTGPLLRRQSAADYALSFYLWFAAAEWPRTVIRARAALVAVLSRRHCRPSADFGVLTDGGRARGAKVLSAGDTGPYRPATSGGIVLV